jgi:hypothetical protein
MSEDYDDEVARKKILKEGKEVDAIITSCICSDDPEDSEHSIFKIEFEYFINEIKVQKDFEFSINTMHITYAHEGLLLGVTKLEYSLDDFKKSLMPGEILRIISLDKPPFEYLNKLNKIALAVWKIPEVWS